MVIEAPLPHVDLPQVPAPQPFPPTPVFKPLVIWYLATTEAPPPLATVALAVTGVGVYAPLTVMAERAASDLAIIL